MNFKNFSRRKNIFYLNKKIGRYRGMIPLRTMVSVLILLINRTISLFFIKYYCKLSWFENHSCFKIYSSIYKKFYVNNFTLVITRSRINIYCKSFDKKGNNNYPYPWDFRFFFSFWNVWGVCLAHARCPFQLWEVHFIIL